jgi:hypothetical protein
MNFSQKTRENTRTHGMTRSAAPWNYSATESLKEARAKKVDSPQNRPQQEAHEEASIQQVIGFRW